MAFKGMSAPGSQDEFTALEVEHILPDKPEPGAAGVVRCGQSGQELRPIETSWTPMAKKLKLQESRVVIHPGVASPRLVRYVFWGDQWPIVDCGQKGGLMEWARILAYITGTVDQELLLRNEYLARASLIGNSFKARQHQP